MIYDVIIMGAGIAGMTAAIYARRAGKSVLVIEEKVYGGQIVNTLAVENWPGYQSISGAELSEKIYHQMNNFSVKMVYERVTGIRHAVRKVQIDKEAEKGESAQIYEVITTGEVYQGKSLIIAVGSEDKKLGLERENELIGHGLSFCATCDGELYKGQNVIVVGGGNTAMYDTLYLAGLAKKVYLVHRRNEFRADAALVEKVCGLENVEMVLGVQPLEYMGKSQIEGLVVEDGPARKMLLAKAIFLAVGRTPATGAFEDLVEMDAKGYIKAGEDCRTSRPGVFAAGDCRVKQVRQLVTAASDGAIAATGAVEYLQSMV